MDFKQIEAFVYVAKLKSFSKAADALFFTQPTMSSHVSNLENELGIKLLERRSKSVELTPQGLVFFQYAVEMINSRGQAIEALFGEKKAISGMIGIETSSVPGVAFLPEIVSEFSKKYSEVKFIIEQSDTAEVINSIIERRGEIGFVGSKENSGNLDYTEVFKDSSVMIASKALHLGNVVNIEEISELPLIWRETGSATRRSFELYAQSIGYDKSKFKTIAVINDLNAIVRAVMIGLGVAIISKKTAEVVANENIDIVNIEGYEEERSFYMVTLRNVALSPATQALRSFIIERTAKQNDNEYGR